MQMILHAHTIILSILCLIGTFMDLRTTYIVMIPLFFYGCSLLLNIITNLQGKGKVF